MTAKPLLRPHEPHPVLIYRSEGRSPFLLVCDHAGRRLPEALDRLGLPEPEFDRHIAYDIGASAVSQAVADRLDAVLIEQRYSRLVIDCNRPPEVDSSVPALSESTPIPGNLGLAPSDKERRVVEIFDPYHGTISAEIDRRQRAGQTTVLIAMHSFTPVYKAVTRPWHVGTLYGRDARLAGPLRAALAGEDGLVVGDNQPYAVSDTTDYTIPVHGERRGLLHVGIEIRQDLVAGATGQTRWAELLSALLPQAMARAEPALA